MAKLGAMVVGWLALKGKIHGPDADERAAAGQDAQRRAAAGQDAHRRAAAGPDASAAAGASAAREADDRAHGRAADKPSQIPARGWKDIAMRVKSEVSDDNVSFLAAGVAFYGFFAIFPALAALVSVYGMVADPADVQKHLLELTGTLPQEARALLTDQMSRLVKQQESALGLGAIFGVLLALWSANKGMSGLVKALNLSYDQKESRGFFKLNAITLGLTAGAVLLVVTAIALIVALPALLDTLGLGAAGAFAVRWLRWPLLALMLLSSLAVLYRYGPCRDKPRWRWVSWGSAIAAGLWIVASAGFSLYASRFGSFDKTYGSMAAVIVLLMWLNISSFVVLLGAEVNAEIEHQTAKDTTSGPERPLGQRGAYVADTVGASA